MTLDFVFETCTGHPTSYWLERGELDWYDSYANPRTDAGKGVLTANWNNFPHGGRQWVQGQGYPDTIVTPFGLKRNGTTTEAHRRFERILEEMGYQLEWSDQTSRCDHCYGCITEGPDYYGDSAHMAILGDCDVVCEDCIRKDYTAEYLEGLEDQTVAANIQGVDPAKHGYKRIAGDYESGFHPGQTDNPRTILKALEQQGYTGVVFKVDASGQFDVRFSVYAKRRPTMEHWQTVLTAEYEVTSCG